MSRKRGRLKDIVQPESTTMRSRKPEFTLIEGIFLTIALNSRPQPRAEKSTKVLRIRACRDSRDVAPHEGALVAG
jgi:hypothetical protein